MFCGPESVSWYSPGRWPVCLCGYAPQDNGLLTAHWRAAGFEVVDENGTLTKREI